MYLEPERAEYLATDIHQDNVAAGWWTALKPVPAVMQGQPLNRNVGELLMLVVSEISEASHGVEHGLNDDKLPERSMLEVELADTAIRLFDMAGGLKLDIAGALREPRVMNTPILFLGDEDIQVALMRLVNFASAAMEGHRKDRADPLVPGRKQFEVRIALLLRGIWELGAYCGLDVDAAIEEKRLFNAKRADHKIENRLAVGGKQY